MLIPKIPSINIIDLQMQLTRKWKNHRYRLGKLHEILFSEEESENALEFKNYFIIKPSIVFSKRGNFNINSSNEKGKKLNSIYAYSSNTNKKFLNLKEIKNILKIND